jgi:type IV secretion system protein TrbG
MEFGLVKKYFHYSAIVAALLAIALPASAGAAAPQMQDGVVRYAYGGSNEPTLVCKPLYVCDIVLEPGESVLNIATGDSSRWVIASAQSGPSGDTPHVLIKPTQVGLRTNLVITTTKRTYYVLLASSDETLYPRIGFYYPEEAAAQAAAAQAAQRAKEADDMTRLPLLPPNELDVQYDVTGAQSLMPTRVFNDRVHTYIEYEPQLPVDAPVVTMVGPGGDDQIINYRIIGNLYIIDGVPHELRLTQDAGTGRRGRGERRVDIRHK